MVLIYKKEKKERKKKKNIHILDIFLFYIFTLILKKLKCFFLSLYSFTKNKSNQNY